MCIILRFLHWTFSWLLPLLFLLLHCTPCWMNRYSRLLAKTFSLFSISLMEQPWPAKAPDSDQMGKRIAIESITGVLWFIVLSPVIRGLDVEGLSVRLNSTIQFLYFDRLFLFLGSEILFVYPHLKLNPFTGVRLCCVSFVAFRKRWSPDCEDGNSCGSTDNSVCLVWIRTRMQFRP